MRTKLARYLSKHRIRQIDFAKSLGVSTASVAQWCSAKRRPDLGSALAIERETGGAIAAGYWATVEKNRDPSDLRRKSA